MSVLFVSFVKLYVLYIIVQYELICICLKITGGATLIFETELVAVNGKPSSDDEKINDDEL